MARQAGLAPLSSSSEHWRAFASTGPPPARRVWPRRDHRAGRQELARRDRLVRGNRERRPLGLAVTPPKSVVLPNPEAAHPPPGLVQGRLLRAARDASPRR